MTIVSHDENNIGHFVPPITSGWIKFPMSLDYQNKNNLKRIHKLHLNVLQLDWTSVFNYLKSYLIFHMK